MPPRELCPVASSSRLRLLATSLFLPPLQRRLGVWQNRRLLLAVVMPSHTIRQSTTIIIMVTSPRQSCRRIAVVQRRDPTMATPCLRIAAVVGSTSMLLLHQNIITILDIIIPILLAISPTRIIPTIMQPPHLRHFRIIQVKLVVAVGCLALRGSSPESAVIQNNHRLRRIQWV